MHQGYENVFERALLGVEVFEVDAAFAELFQQAGDAGVIGLSIEAIDELTAFAGELEIVAVNLRRVDQWRGEFNYVELDPYFLPFHLFKIEKMR